MRRGLVIVLLLGVAALVGVSQVQRSDALFHLMRVYGVMAGASADPNVQYVELRMASAGQTLVSGRHLCLFDATGSPYARFTFTSNVVNGANGSSILVGTSEFDAAWAAGSPDFLFSGANTIAIAGGADVAHPVRSPGGKVSFGTDSTATPALMCQASFLLVDSVAYGTGYSGAVNFGTNLNADLPTAGTNAVRLQGPVCFFCIRDNSTDYAITDVNVPADYPRNNAGLAGPVGGSSATFDVLKDFVPDAGASVTVSLSCTSGVVSPASASASEAVPAVFTITGFTPDPNCIATESPVPTGYTSSGTCNAALVAVGQCTITNTQNVDTFDVLKDFLDDSGALVTFTLTCDTGVVTPASATATEVSPATFTVTGFTPDPNCIATESPVPAGYTSSGTCNAALVAVGQCTITNTPDSDGDGVPDSSDNCPAWPNPGQGLPPWPVPVGDADCDSWTDADEALITTDPRDACGLTVVGTAGGANPSETWPPDLNRNNAINIFDVLALKHPFGSSVPPASARFDLKPGSGINIFDVLAMKPVFGASCTP